MTLNNVWKYSLSLKAVPAHFTKYITTVTVYQATSSINSQVTSSSNSDLESCLQFNCSSCAFPQLHWLSPMSIFNWWKVVLGLHFHSLEWARSFSSVQRASVAALTEAAAGEMHQAVIIKVWEIAPHSRCTQFVKQRCADDVNQHYTALLD